MSDVCYFVLLSPKGDERRVSSMEHTAAPRTPLDMASLLMAVSVVCRDMAEDLLH